MDTRDPPKRGRKTKSEIMKNAGVMKCAPPRSQKVTPTCMDTQRAPPTVLTAVIPRPNIILHLKCCISDLYGSSSSTHANAPSMQLSNPITEDIHTQDLITEKLTRLYQELHLDNPMMNDKSACFWCTYEFDGMPVFLPTRYSEKDGYDVQGCFCSPECTAAHLFHATTTDSNTKADRYAMLHQMYRNVYGYSCSTAIKPAPNPHYMLSRFYGNMEIQEYRRLFASPQLFLTLDRPFRRSAHEIFEEHTNDGRKLVRQLFQVRMKKVSS